jgi:hypothetical protein
MKQMRDYIRQDLQDYRPEISNTSKLKAEGLIELLSKMGDLHEKMISQMALRTATYNNMKMLWEDLFLLVANKTLHVI